jgi:hypothetical protein
MDPRRAQNSPAKFFTIADCTVLLPLFMLVLLGSR